MPVTAYRIITIQDKQIGLQLPNNYDPSNAYPLIVFLHGRGGSLENNNFSSAEFTDFRSKAAERGYIVITPDYGSDGWMNRTAEDIVLQSIKLLQAEYKIDSQRLYMMGVSMGGGGVLVFSARHKEMVAGICDIMGVTDMVRLYNDHPDYHDSNSNAYGGSPNQVPNVYAERSALNHIDDLKSIPVLIIHGMEDSLVPIHHSDRMYNALKSAGANVEYIKVPGIGHENGLIRGQEDHILDFLDNAPAISMP